jgi:glycosyltransferase involved in cell wall biosynthesis
MNTPLISFCIPFYSNKPLLEAALKSVLRQSLESWEAIVIDDCGPEIGVEEMVNNFGDSRIKYLRNPRNLGLAGNWNRCLLEARAPLVTILHADDVLEPDYAKLMVFANAKYPSAAAYFCRTRIIDIVGKKIFSFPDFIKLLIMPSRNTVMHLRGQDAVRNLLRGNFIFCPSLCYQRKMIQNELFSAEWKMVLDMDFVLRLLFQNHEIIGLPSVAYVYRRHGTSQTALLTQSFIRFEEEASLYDRIYEQAKEKGWHSAAQVALSKKIIKLHILYMSVQDFVRLRFRQIGHKFKLLRSI